MNQVSSRNNESRKDCTWFCNVMGMERIGTSNMFKYQGKVWCYTNGTKNNTIRQLYDQADGAYVGGRFVSRKDMTVGEITRISAKMGVARNAKYP
jgi:hypothetical protein